MPRNPIVGGDRNTWGTVLNEKLNGIDRTDPGAAGTVGQLLTIDQDGPAWLDDPVFNVKHPRFGAVGDGTADDTAAINAAVTVAKAAGGGVIQFPTGNYRLTSAIVTGGSGTGITFRGAGMYATQLMMNHATEDVFRFVSTDQLISVEDMGITVPTSQSRTAGSAIYINGANDVNIRNIRIGSTYNLITVDNDASRILIDTVRYYREPTGTGTINRGVFLQVCTVVQVHRMMGTLGTGFSLPSTTAMFHVDSGVDTAIFTECGDVSGGHGSAGHGFRLTHSLGGASFPPRIVRIQRCFDEAGDGFASYLVEAGQDIEIANSYAATQTTGFLFSGGKEIRVNNCIAYNSGRHGFEVAAGCDDITLDHCSASDNSQETHNTYAGFAITPGSKTYFAVTHCRAGDWLLGMTNKQAYGVVVYGGTATSYRVQDNYARGNATAQVSDNGTASGTKVVTGNLP